MVLSCSLSPAIWNGLGLGLHPRSCKLNAVLAVRNSRQSPILILCARLRLVKFLRVLDFVLKPKIALAHCDIPCGIYETNTLLMAAQTVVRMVEVMEALPMDKPSLQDRNNFIRCVHVKEKHASLCEEQLVTLWAYFFKQEHFEKWPDLHGKFWKAVNLASDNKQNVSREKAKELMASCREISQIFDQVKVAPKDNLVGVVSDNPESPKKKLMS